MYQLDDEAAREPADKTVHSIMHLGWAPTIEGGYELRRAALVRPNGLFGRLYMAAIAPSRYPVVYPALTRPWERAWLDHGRHPRQPDGRAVSAECAGPDRPGHAGRTAVSEPAAPPQRMGRPK